MSLMKKLASRPKATVDRARGNYSTMPAVARSGDLARVKALPRRPRPDAKALEALVAKWNGKLKRNNPKCKCASLGRPCYTTLLPIQAWALEEMSIVGGLLGPIGVGAGKSLIDIFAAMAVPNVKTAVLLVPPSLVGQLQFDYRLASEHFETPSLIVGPSGGTIKKGRPVVRVVPFSKFSLASSSNLLEAIRPDLIIVDEAHKIRDPQSARTSRVLRYFANHPETRMCAWSGTLLSRSIKDACHLSAFSLGEGSPFPLDPDTADEWASALDPSDLPAEPGRLLELCNPGEPVLEGFHRRLVDTPGVVATSVSAVDASVIIEERHPPKMPSELASMIATLRREQVRPDGEELVNATEVAACAKQLACGFYYRWRFPRGEPEEMIDLWFACRKAWGKELRAVLQSRKEFLDSPLLCLKAALRHEHGYDGELPSWESRTLSAWLAIKDQVYHETEVVWVDDYLARDAVAWAKKHRGIVWYEHRAFGAKVAALGGLQLHTGGPDAEERIRAITGNESIVCSIKSHGTGRDGLQRFYNEQLVANPPSSGDTVEQLLGRLHRQGQKADEVITWFYRHTKEMAESIDKALAQAKFVKAALGADQKLLLASADWLR